MLSNNDDKKIIISAVLALLALQIFLATAAPQPPEKTIYIIGDGAAYASELEGRGFKVRLARPASQIDLEALDVLVLAGKAEVPGDVLDRVARSGKAVIGIGEATHIVQRLAAKYLAVYPEGQAGLIGFILQGRLGGKYRGIIFGASRPTADALIHAVEELSGKLPSSPRLMSEGWSILSSFIYEYTCSPYGNVYIKEYVYVNTEEVDSSHDYYLIKEGTTLISGASRYGSTWKNAGVHSLYDVGAYTGVFTIGDFDPDSDLYEPSTITVTISVYPPSISWTYNSNHNLWQVDLQVYSMRKVGWTHKFYLTAGEVTVKPGLGVVSEEASSGRISVLIEGIFARRMGYTYQYHTCRYPFTLYLSKP